MNHKITVISNVEMARRNILMRAFHCHQNSLPFLDDHISRETRLIFLDMLSESLLEQSRAGYTITQKGIAHWRRIIKEQHKSTLAQAGIFRQLLEDYDHTGAPVAPGASHA